MLFSVEENLKNIIPLRYKNISEKYGENEKKLEELLKDMIGKDIFPQYLVFGNERKWQREADLFAVDSQGNLILIELKVGGQYDTEKIYQGMRYAQEFSHWKYEDMNDHFKKCFPSDVCNSLLERFKQQFLGSISTSVFNKKQKIIIISNASDLAVSSISDYWRSLGVDIMEYFYRFYEVNNETILEISSDLVPIPGGDCWINTCRTFIPDAYIDMVRNSKAAVYGNRVNLIGSWMDKSNVFLYHNGYGIIAAGRGTNQTKEFTNSVFDKPEFERSMILRDFIHGVCLSTGEIDDFISIKEIRNILDRDLYFAQSAVGLSENEGQELYRHCEKRFRKFDENK